MTVEAKRYIGDGVYAAFDGFALILTTENGIDVTNRIVLKPREWEELTKYVEAFLSRPTATELGLAAVEALKEEEARGPDGLPQTEDEPTCADLGCFES